MQAFTFGCLQTQAGVQLIIRVALGVPHTCTCLALCSACLQVIQEGPDTDMTRAQAVRCLLLLEFAAVTQVG